MCRKQTGAIIVVLIAGMMGLVGSASAEDSGDTKAYFSPLVIPAAAFVNDGVDPDGFEFANGSVIGTGVKVNMVAPVYLPEGATIHSFRAYLYDNDDVCDTNGEDIDLFLVRTSLVTGSVQTVAIAASDGASGLVNFVPTHTLYSAYTIVNNTSYQYWIHMRICSASHRLKAVVIGY